MRRPRRHWRKAGLLSSGDRYRVSCVPSQPGWATSCCRGTGVEGQTRWSRRDRPRDFHHLPTGAWTSEGSAPVDSLWKSLRAPERGPIPVGELGAVRPELLRWRTADRAELTYLITPGQHTEFLTPRASRDTYKYHFKCGNKILHTTSPTIFNVVCRSAGGTSTPVVISCRSEVPPHGMAPRLGRASSELTGSRLGPEFLPLAWLPRRAILPSGITRVDLVPIRGHSLTVVSRQSQTRIVRRHAPSTDRFRRSRTPEPHEVDPALTARYRGVATYPLRLQRLPHSFMVHGTGRLSPLLEHLLRESYSFTLVESVRRPCRQDTMRTPA